MNIIICETIIAHSKSSSVHCCCCSRCCFQTVHPELSGLQWQERSNNRPVPDHDHSQYDTRILLDLLVYECVCDNEPLFSVQSAAERKISEYTHMHTYIHTHAVQTEVKHWLIPFVCWESPLSFTCFLLSPEKPSHSWLSHDTHRRKHRVIVKVWLLSFRTSMGIMMKLGTSFVIFVICQKLLILWETEACLSSKCRNRALLKSLSRKAKASWEPGYWRWDQVEMTITGCDR